MKKPFKVYYFLACEGHTEFIMFAYLKNRYRQLFRSANVKFREPRDDGVFSNGKLNGVKSLEHFEGIYSQIKQDYPDETFLFFLDEDLYHSPQIGKKIKDGGDMVQFIKYNSEFLLLTLSGHTLKDISDFKPDFQGFRDYCKEEFRKVFGDDAKRIINDDFLNGILGDVTDEVIMQKFDVIFGLCDN